MPPGKFCCPSPPLLLVPVQVQCCSSRTRFTPAQSVPDSYISNYLISSWFQPGYGICRWFRDPQPTEPGLGYFTHTTIPSSEPDRPGEMRTMDTIPQALPNLLPGLTAQAAKCKTILLIKNSRSLCMCVFSHTLNTFILLVLRILAVKISLFEDGNFAVVERTFNCLCVCWSLIRINSF